MSSKKGSSKKKKSSKKKREKSYKKKKAWHGKKKSGVSGKTGKPDKAGGILSQVPFFRNAERFLNIFNDVILIIGKNKKVLYVNNACRRYGFHTDDLVGKQFTSFIPKKYLPLHAKMWIHLKLGKTVWGKTEICTKKGVLFFSFSSLPIKKKGRFVASLSILREITEQKKAEERIEESEQKFRSIFRGSADAMLIADTQTRALVDCNPAAEKMMGLSKEKILKMRADQLHPRDKVEETMKVFKKQAKGERIIAESEVLTKDKKRIPVSINTAIIKIKGKSYLIGIFRDITEQKKARREMLEAYQAQSSIVENAPFGVFTVDREGKVKYVNPAMLEISGNEEKVFMDINVFKLPSYAKLGLSKKIRECFKGIPFFVGPLEYFSFYSNKRSVRNFTGIPMRDKQGRVEEVMVFVEDLTEIKKAEEELEKSQRKFKHFVSSASAIICKLNPKGKTLYASPYTEELTGYKVRELVGKNWWDVLYPGKLHSQVKDLYEEFKKGDVRDYELRLKTKKGRERVISWSSFNRYEEKGSENRRKAGKKVRDLIEINGVGIDITERKEVEADLKGRTQELEKFNKLAVGRELKMIELKNKVKELKKEIKELETKLKKNQQRNKK